MSDQSDEDVGDGGVGVEVEEEESLASRRSRRSRGDKGGRLAALEKLRNAKSRGVKNKYEVKELENVYDVVDEDTYSRKVNDRLQDDWIVDDGTGYCETGHELFDDDLLDDDGYGGSSSNKRKNKGKQSRKSTKEERQHEKSNFLSVRDMLTNMPAKRKRDPAEDHHNNGSSSSNAPGADDLLGEMLMELNEDSSKAKKVKPDQKSGMKLLSVLTNANNMPSSMKRRRDADTAETADQFEQECMSIFEKTAAASSSSSACSNGGSTRFVKKEVKIEPRTFDYGDDDNDIGFEPEPMAIDESSSMTKDPPTTTMKKETKVEPKTINKDSSSTTSNKKIVQALEDANIEFKTVEPELGPSKGHLIVDEEEAKVEFMTSDGSGNNQVMNFFWFDIYEEPRNPGTLYLFGKVGQQGAVGGNGFVSCCLIIKNVERCMYILPREKMRDDEEEDVTFPDVYAEFEKLAPKLKIPEFKARKTTKKYCFGVENVPKSSEYMEVCYAGTLAPLPENFEGNTFSRVFGTHSSMLENFLLKKKFRGPSWLQIANPVQVDPSEHQSWCKMEFTCQVGGIQIHPKKDSLNIPPFVVASLNINSVSDPASKKDTIISASVVVNRNFKIHSSAVTTAGLFQESFCLINKPVGEIWPFDVDRVLPKSTTKMDSERSMLACLLAKLSQFDADIYVGHDLNLDLLLQQLWNHKVPHWSRIGRLKRSSQPQKGGRMPDSRSAVAGRLVCDVKISAMELIRARSYELASLASQVLGISEDQISSYTGAELRHFFESSDGIKHLTAWGMSLSILNLRLVNELQVMPLALQITAIAGNTLARTLMGGRSERNEFLLLHAFYNKDYIVPDKQYKKKFFKREEDDEDEAAGKAVTNKKGKSGGPSYAGGLVLEPKKGFYDNFIVLMDFLSLYPSIIQEYNICFTTTTTEDRTDDTDRGILPEEIRKLVQSRREVKKLMQAENVSNDLKRQYDIRQKALKLTANSMYGCLGFRNSRFYAQNLAALITGKGREILMKTKEAVEKMGFEVIYGDTDSLMINTNTQEIQKVYQIGNKIRIEINRMYKLLELEIDGVFRFLLLLKKKKYAAMIYNVKPNGETETTMELKGLDIVRRDWAPVAAITARSILDEIMTEQPLDDKIFKIVKILSDKAEELKAGSVPMKDLIITKQLAKNPEEYKDPKGLHHVTVALRMNSNGKLAKKFKNGDTVPYLFCTDGLPHHPAELIESQAKGKVDAAAKAENDKQVVAAGPSSSAPIKLEGILEMDPSYYLSQQVHPVVSRICEPIPGLDAARIAEAMGMDPTSYKRKRVVENSHEDMSLGEMSEAEKYQDCPRFKFLCPGVDCRREIVIQSPVTELNGGELMFSLSKCLGCTISPFSYMPRILNNLTLFMRKFIEKYYQGWFMCEDPACPNRERAVNLQLERGYLVCPCKQGVMVREYTDADLHKQLSYLLYVFDVAKRMEEVPMERKQKLELTETRRTEVEFAKMSALVKKQLARSAYSEICLGDLFADLIPKAKFVFPNKDKKQNDKKKQGGKSSESATLSSSNK